MLFRYLTKKTGLPKLQMNYEYNGHSMDIGVFDPTHPLFVPFCVAFLATNMVIATMIKAVEKRCNFRSRQAPNKINILCKSTLDLIRSTVGNIVAKFYIIHEIPDGHKYSGEGTVQKQVYILDNQQLLIINEIYG